MDIVRKPFQGVLNIINFNRHFYFIALILMLLIFFGSAYASPIIKQFLSMINLLLCITVSISLLVSYYVYDLSDFYKLNWIKNNDKSISIININAGFDETSAILKVKYPNSSIKVLDFYNPNKHTQISIKRARNHYPPIPNTIKTETSKLAIESNSTDKVFVILAAHEIRDLKERIQFFSEINRILKPDGQLIVIEHLRDLANFIAFNIGSLHFYSKATWLKTFNASNLKFVLDVKKTPFISTFILQKDGNTL